MNFNMRPLLKDKTVLYIVLFFAVTNFFGYILLKNYDAVIFMILIGLITSYFSKNMIVILLSSIVVTTLLTSLTTVKEGFDAKKNEHPDVHEDPSGVHVDASNNKVKSKNTDKDGKSDKDGKTKSDKKENFSNELSPQLLEDVDNSGKDGYHAASENIDQNIADPHSKEGAIDNLDQILSNGSDTASLIQNHKAVVKNMKNLEPLIASTQSLVDGLKNSGLIENLSNVRATLANR